MTPAVFIAMIERKEETDTVCPLLSIFGDATRDRIFIGSNCTRSTGGRLKICIFGWASDLTPSSELLRKCPFSSKQNVSYGKKLGASGPSLSLPTVLYNDDSKLDIRNREHAI